MKNPKVGDRVMVYDISLREGPGMVGIISDISSKSPYFTVELCAAKSRVHVHRCQCIKLKPKKVRRTIWAKFNGEGTFILDAMNKRPKTCWHNNPSSCDDSCYDPDWFEFREVRK